MEFDPNNIVVKCCIEGMELEAQGKQEEASRLFLQAWNEATNDFEKFTAAHHVARLQKDVSERLKWHKTALQFALKVNDDSVKGAIATQYSNIARCYEVLNDTDNAKKNYDLATSHTGNPSDNGPFYHGTRADLQVGDMLTAGRMSNYNADITMNHIYFSAVVNAAGLAAALAKGDGLERVYIIEPTGSFENDPNVTDKKFPGNPTRSYRTHEPLKIIGEATDWTKLTPEEIQKWREKLAKSTGEIIN